jgi:hypothetical protein
MNRPPLAIALLAALLSCDGADDTGDTQAPAVAPSWAVIHDGLSGAVLSVGGTSSSDIWLAGADPGDGGGPVAMHFDGASWTDLDPGVSGSLWWVDGTGSESVWFCGDDGLLLRFDRDSASFEQISTDTDATLFGVWAAPDGPVYAVGGIVETEDSAVILRVSDGVATAVTDLPSGLDAAELWFKPWGTAADDVWVIGDRGTVLHFDGAAWSRQVFPDSPRLVTLSGAGTDDMVVVGGTTQGVIYERADGPWGDASPAGVAPLNGVFVASDGTAAAVGMSSAVLVRESGTWRTLTNPPVLGDWHGAWIDERGSVYAAGGDFINLRDGALVRYGVSE